MSEINWRYLQTGGPDMEIIRLPENAVIVLEDGILGEMRALCVALQIKFRSTEFDRLHVEYWQTLNSIQTAMDGLDKYGGLESMYPYLMKMCREARQNVAKLTNI